MFIFCKEAVFKIQPVTDPEVNVEKIEENVGCSFNLIKTDSIGHTTSHKFLWICLDDELDTVRLENLSHAIIKDIYTVRPGRYHSFTIHFFKTEDLCHTIEDSNPFAKIEFLPEGKWSYVGRRPINEYKDYLLVSSWYNQ